VCEASEQPFEVAVPVLAQAMCLSPFDAAIHDAAGEALGISAMRLYEGKPAATSADVWFPAQKGGQGGAFEAIAQMLRPSPRDGFDAWLLVGKNDDLEKDVRPWVEGRGYRSFKLKLHGQDAAEDVRRTAEVTQAAIGWGTRPRLSVDTNESSESAAFVLDYLQRLQKDHPEAFDCLEYLEQPTARDIEASPFDWRQVHKLKPVLLDEGLTSLDRLPLALQQGWSGLALKTCKGHSFALVAAAWAHANGLVIAMQDLTNPGWSAVHSALFAAWIPTMNGVELNSPQFTPQANMEFLQAWPDLFDVRDGVHRLGQTQPTGLGSSITPLD